jgi:hypothetical protein
MKNRWFGIECALWFAVLPAGGFETEFDRPGKIENGMDNE